MSVILEVTSACENLLVFVGISIAVRYNVGSFLRNVLKSTYSTVFGMHSDRKGVNFIFDNLVCFPFVDKHHLHELILSGYKCVGVTTFSNTWGIRSHILSSILSLKKICFFESMSQTVKMNRVWAICSFASSVSLQFLSKLSGRSLWWSSFLICCICLISFVGTKLMVECVSHNVRIKGFVFIEFHHWFSCVILMNFAPVVMPSRCSFSMVYITWIFGGI